MTQKMASLKRDLETVQARIRQGPPGAADTWQRWQLDVHNLLVTELDTALRQLALAETLGCSLETWPARFTLVWDAYHEAYVSRGLRCQICTPADSQDGPVAPLQTA